jgi:hypothetical protein
MFLLQTRFGERTTFAKIDKIRSTPFRKSQSKSGAKRQDPPSQKTSSVGEWFVSPPTPV